MLGLSHSKQKVKLKGYLLQGEDGDEDHDQEGVLKEVDQ